MKYILLIYSDEATNPVPGTDTFNDYLARFGAFSKEVEDAGVFVAGEPLESVTNASTVSIRDGSTSVTDGPFAETKEQLGGFYILDCPNLDVALEYAAKIPAAEHGRIEVRPVLDLSCGG